MMGRRKSIGRDPLDWVGETAAPGEGRAGGENGGGTSPKDDAHPPASGSPQVPAESRLISLSAPTTAFQLERQLLLVDGILRERNGRPRLNRVLGALLVLVAFLGGGILFFQETRRHWDARIVTLEGAIERVENEKGRNERMLAQLIAEKDGLIQEKQRTISKMEVIHQSTMEELRLTLHESRQLLSENQTLLQRMVEARDPHQEGIDPARPGAANQASPPGD